MVRLHVKKMSESQFLYDTSVESKVDDVIREITIIHNGRLKVSRICYDMEDLANHGTMLPPNMMGLTDEQVEELHLKDEWGEKCIPSGGWTYNRDVIGRRNGKQPNENMQNVIKKAIEDARAMISKKLVNEDKLVTQKVVQDALDILRGAVMIVYPMGLPPHDVIDLQMAQLWFSGKELLRGTLLKDSVGRNEKTKIVVKIAKRGSGAPPREPVMSDEDRKQLMLQAHRRQEEVKRALSGRGLLTSRAGYFVGPQGLSRPAHRRPQEVADGTGCAEGHHLAAARERRSYCSSGQAVARAVAGYS
ncbi:hypothetical protein QAD02_014427 [Eretmocerus hayati]|uniref:Uncharacterized protein n=1 Tax=Eretmocerus hayati TaxID=131215 RepID=A0ACC2P509_9HYME|nr:hypothetical protein QAD02_014427 [Eretmocerus hayati]